jgi:hypothetical protein
MNRIRIASAALFLLSATFAYGVQPRQEPQQPQQDEPKAKPDKHEPKQKQQDEPKVKPEKEVPRDQDANKPSKHDDAKAPKQDDSKPAKQEKNAKSDTRKDEQSQQAHGGRSGNGGRIPDEKFRSNFGRQHTFRVGHPQSSGGQPRFQYSGYSFEIVDAWPVGWDYNDDCYIDLIDGEYFIFDMIHPGVRISVTVIS